MTLRDHIRKYLGLDTIETTVKAIDYNTHNLNNLVSNHQKAIAIQSQGLGRIIAKLDPIFTRSENPADDAVRKAESDEIGLQVIKKLEAEYKARTPYNL